ncbi:hypothetical protein BGW80DRAFT_1309141 [Lactifluus volemus]|nr:hypothetical protein BGW80DRAFT_1309141 [Lactifluus volemus]
MLSPRCCRTWRIFTTLCCALSNLVIPARVVLLYTSCSAPLSTCPSLLPYSRHYAASQHCSGYAYIYPRYPHPPIPFRWLNFNLYSIYLFFFREWAMRYAKEGEKGAKVIALTVVHSKYSTTSPSVTNVAH